MKQITRTIFILTITYSLLPGAISAQTIKNFNFIIGKCFVTQTDYINFKSDTLLECSLINPGRNQPYHIKADTLILKDAYRWYGGHNSTSYTVNYYPYKILKCNSDSIVIKQAFNSFGDGVKQDILTFVNIENLKKPVTHFRYIKMNASYPLSGCSLEVEIDSTGWVKYNKSYSDVFNDAKPPETIKGYLSKTELLKFINLLSGSMLTSLPAERGCGLDASPIWFEVLMNEKRFFTRGCTLYYLQWQLYNYLYSLDNNKEFEQDK